MKTTTRGTIVALALAVALLPGSTVLADFEQGMNLFKAGKHAEAAAEFQALVDQAPNYDFGYYMLGLSFFKMGKLGDAASNIEKARDLNGDRFEYHHALASVHRANRQNPKALKELNDAEGLVDASKNYAFYSLRGFVRADLEHWADAVEDLEKARAAKSSGQVLDYLGKAYFKLRHFDKAVPVLREAARANPNDVNTHIFLAESLINHAKENQAKKSALFSEALQVARKARSMKPDDWQTVNLAGKAALGANDFKAAEEAFNSVLTMKPDYCYAMVNLSRALIAQERWKDAEQISRKATTCAPRLSAGYESLGYALQKQTRLDEALETYKRALAINPSGSVKELMRVVEENIRIREENIKIEQEKRAEEEAIAKEQQRLKEEEEKRREWERKQDD